MPNDHFSFRQFTVRQDRCAMKVGTDGTLLGAWAQLPPAASSRACSSPARILDIGTGTGLIALMMAQRYPAATVTGIDIDGDAVGQARQNAASSPFAPRITILGGDVRTMVPEDGTPFDAIVCNPPYFADSLQSPDARRTLARHAATLTFRQLMECASRLLADHGQLSIVIPAEGKAQIEAEAALAALFKVRQCDVRTAPAKAPRRHLMAFAKHPAAIHTAEMTIGSEYYRELTKDFYLK